MNSNWHEANQRYLMRAIAEVRSHIEQFLMQSDGKESVSAPVMEQPLPEMPAELKKIIEEMK